MLTMVKNNFLALAIIAATGIYIGGQFMEHSSFFEDEARRDFEKIDDHITALEEKVSSLSEDVAVLKSETSSIKEDVEWVRRFLYESEQALNWTQRAPVFGYLAGAP